MQTEKQVKKDSEGYCCSNPNCKSVFSYPKIIKYYVCPICQSLVEMEGVSNQPVIEESINEEKCLLVDSNSIKAQKSEEIEDLKTKIEGKLEDITKLKTENTNLNKKLEDIEKNLGISKGQIESMNRKLGAKNEELAEVTEKNLNLSTRIESLETERVSYKIKIREIAGRIEGLETRISDKDKNIKNLDERLGEFREEVGTLTKQIEDGITEKNELIAKHTRAERKAYQEIELRAKIQGELVDLRENMANSIRREGKTAENSLEDEKKIHDLELEVKTLKEEKQLTKTQIQKSKNIEFEHTVDDVQGLEANKIKINKQEKSAKVQDLNSNKLLTSEQTLTNGVEEEYKSGNECCFYFGYLSERDKRESISPACVECPKSLECMLFKVYKSTEPIRELSKWYSINV